MGVPGRQGSASIKDGPKVQGKNGGESRPRGAEAGACADELKRFMLVLMDRCQDTLTWRTPVTRMHYGKKASGRGQCDALVDVLLGNSFRPCGCLTCSKYLSVPADHVCPHTDTVLPDDTLP